MLEYLYAYVANESTLRQPRPQGGFSLASEVGTRLTLRQPM